MYMNQKEVVDALSQHSKIEPCITELGNAYCSPPVQWYDSFLLLASWSKVISCISGSAVSPMLQLDSVLRWNTDIMFYTSDPKSSYNALSKQFSSPLYHLLSYAPQIYRLNDKHVF